MVSQSHTLKSLPTTLLSGIVFQLGRFRMKIGIIGKGKVGTAIAKGLTGKGHEIRHGHRDPTESVSEAANFGEVVFLAVPFENVSDAVKEIGSAVDGKTLVDVTNALDENMDLAIGCSTSGAEELQKMLPKAHVVKAFNTVFAPNQSVGKIGNERLTLFVAGDDIQAKQTVMGLGRDIGFDSVDAGSLSSARFLEPMGVLMINLGLKMGLGTGIGFRLVKA